MALEGILLVLALIMTFKACSPDARQQGQGSVDP
jgi:hypothetical protein